MSSSSLSDPSFLPRSSVDDEGFNSKVTPDWNHYRTVVEGYGYRLDTVRDVKAFYEHRLAAQSSQEPLAVHLPAVHLWKGYPTNGAEDDLCRDHGLPDTLFRGTRHRDGKRLVIKAVNIRSHELDVIQYLSSPSLRIDPANHTIPVLDIIRIPRDSIAFIVQEEWPSSLAHSAPSSIHGFLHAIRQCIEGLNFMHLHGVAHLDLSLSNIVTNCVGSYAYIDFEMSRRFPGDKSPMIRSIRGTELPPEIERGHKSCPYKIDIWALGVIILRACKASGYDIYELLLLTQPMLRENPRDRPSASILLHEFDRIFGHKEDQKLKD